MHVTIAAALIAATTLATSVVVKDGIVLLQKGFGYADVDKRMPRP